MYAGYWLEEGAIARDSQEIGIAMNGNSGWGRVIFELTDASGQR